MNTCRRKKRDKRKRERGREILNRPMERGEKVYAGNEFFLSREQILLCKSGQCRVPGRYTTDLIRVAGTNLRFALPFARA